MRPLVLAAALALAACGPSPSGLSPEAAYEAHHDALLDGDAVGALALLKEAAEADHLGALETLADARERGYMRAPFDARRKAGTNVAVYSLPGQAEAARERFEAVRDAQARAGDPEAMRSAAFHVLGSDTFIDGRLAADATPAQLDSAAVLYERLLSTDLPRVQLALLAKALGRDDAYDRHVDEAAAAGEPQGCTCKLYMTDDRPDFSGSAGLALLIDRAMACAPEGPGVEIAARPVRTLLDETGRGNAAARVTLDTLRRLGVFERHPRLAALVGEAG